LQWYYSIINFNKGKETPKVTEKKPLFSKPDAALYRFFLVCSCEGLCLTGVAFTLRMWLKPRRVNCFRIYFFYDYDGNGAFLGDGIINRFVENSNQGRNLISTGLFTAVFFLI
jgi:hypothetical protein